MMEPTKSIKVVAISEYRLRLARPLSAGEATYLRGYCGAAFGEELFLHHHHPDGSLLYAYPRVQFKVIDGTARLIGIDEGGAVVERLWKEVDQARLGGEVLPVVEATLHRRREPLGETEALLEYHFVTPWLGLNQDNYRRYQQATVDAERHDLLSRVLIGNCLAVAKSLGHRVQRQLMADASSLRPKGCRFKGVPMYGFQGCFWINFLLPTGLGIGKAVSRGFGTVVRATKVPGEAAPPGVRGLVP